MFRKISVIGLGYIGLPTAAVIASRGVEVIGVDVNQKVVDTINQGKIHIVEPELDIVAQSVVNTGHLRAVTEPEAADAFLVAVPTPFKEGNEPDLRYIEAVSKALAPMLKKGDLVVLESTSPVGATEQMCAWLSDARQDLKFPELNGEPADVFVAHCPERVLPGQVLRELVENDRIIGGMTPACTEAAKKLYRIFVQGELLETDARTAEMAKLTENAFRDVNIAFANELSLICDKLGINVWELIRMANHHPRVNILNPGPGVGGHCIAVDPWFIISQSPESTELMRSARGVNDKKPEYIANKILKKKKELDCSTIAIFGLAYKPDVDDLRESPSVKIVDMLRKETNAELLIVEPHIDELPQRLQVPNCKLVSANEALHDADLLVCLVSHSSFREMFSKSLLNKAVLDFVNIVKE